MPDAQQLIDNIRAFVSAMDQTRTPELIDWANAYAALCRETNERLRRCADYLHRGLRGEAIHLAEKQPLLVDLVAMLDFPEVAEWENLAAMYDLPRPPRILMDVAQELNEAYALDQPLQGQLARHRVLALAKAPLRERIRVLRELAQSDSVNPFWSDDLRTFESARVREIAADATAAVHDGDRPGVQRLLGELKEPSWRYSPPPALVHALERASTGYRRIEAVAMLGALIAPLEAARAAEDHARCVELVAKWKSVAAEAGGAVDDDLASRFDAVRHWTEAETRRQRRRRDFEKACEMLSHAMDADAPEEEIARLKTAAQGLGEAVPEELAARVAKTIEARHAARKRRMVRAYATAAAIVAVIAGAGGAYFHISGQDAEARQWESQLKESIGKLDYVKAEETWKAMTAKSPSMAERPGIAALRPDIKRGLEAEGERASNFAAHFKVATAGGPSNPNMEELRQADRIKRTPEEIRLIADFQATVDGLNAQAALRRQEQFQAKVIALGNDLSRAESDVQIGRVDSARQALGPMAEAMGALERDGSADAEAKEALKPLHARFEQLRTRVAAAQAEASALERVASSGQSAATLVPALKAFVDASPDSPHADSFKKAAANQGVWESVDEFAALAATWRDLRGDSAAELPKRIAAIADHLKKHGASPFKQQAQAYRDYLAAAQSNLDAAGVWKGELKALLASPLMHDLLVIRTNDGKTYYLAPEANYREDSVGSTFNSVVSNDTTHTRQVTIRQANVAAKPSKSAQSGLADEMTRRIDAMGVDNWETTGEDLIDMVAARKDVDPLLRAMLTGWLVKNARSAGWGAGEALAPLAEALAGVNADDVAWMNPDDAAANAARIKAEAVLAKVPGTSEARKTIERARDAVFHAVDFRIAAHAVALRDGSGWKLSSAPAAVEGQGVFIVATGVEGVHVMSQVGQAAGGAFVIDERAMYQTPEGTLVFITPAPKGK